MLPGGQGKVSCPFPVCFSFSAHLQQTHKHARSHARTHTHTHVFLLYKQTKSISSVLRLFQRLCTHTHIHAYTHTYTHTHTHTHTHIPTCCERHTYPRATSRTHTLGGEYRWEASVRVSERECVKTERKRSGPAQSPPAWGHMRPYGE